MLRRISLPMLLVLALASGCSDSPAGGDGGSGDGGSDASMCEERAEAFRSFVSENQSCSSASECTIIGDCGPNADFTAIRMDAAEEGRRLMQERCSGAYDGPLFRASCEAGGCVAVGTGEYCGMIAPPDGGSDGGSDGGTDATADGSADGSVAMQIQSSCEHLEDCGTLTGTVEDCVANTSSTYDDIIAVCPEEMMTLVALLDCLLASSCSDDMPCSDESAAVDAARVRCLGS